MNVRELITELEKHDPDLPVAVADGDWGLCDAEVVGAENYGEENEPFLVLRASTTIDYR